MHSYAATSNAAEEPSSPKEIPSKGETGKVAEDNDPFKDPAQATSEKQQPSLLGKVLGYKTPQSRKDHSPGAHHTRSSTQQAAASPAKEAAANNK